MMTKSPFDPFHVSRRTLIRATAATAAIAAAPALAAGQNVHVCTVDPLLALGKRYQEAVAERQRALFTSRRIWDAIPMPDANKDGWPRIDRSLAIFRDFPPAPDVRHEMHVDRFTRRELEEANRARELAAADPVKLAAEQADGAARLRWHDDILTTRERLHEESGYNAANERWEAACDAVNDIENEIIETPPVTMAGLFVRLRVLRDFVEGEHSNYDYEVGPREEMEWQDRLTLDVMDDLDRLAGNAP